MTQLGPTLALIEKLSRPLAQAQTGVAVFADKTSQSLQSVKEAAAGVSTTWGTLEAALNPAITLYHTLCQQIALGIDSGALAVIADDANTFAMTYGRSAVDFVRSTALINRAIDGLTAAELPKVTSSANLMAMALGGSAQQSSALLGQMFTHSSLKPVVSAGCSLPRCYPAK